MTRLQKIAKHFSVPEADVRYGAGQDNMGRARRGWWIRDVYLGPSYYEVTNTGLWATKTLS